VVAIACGVLLAALAYRPLLAVVAFVIGALALAAGVVLPFIAGRAKQHDWVVPQPTEAPRHLGHVDSWHAVLAGLGAQAESLKRCIVDRLADNAGGAVAVRSERFGHRTANGYDERERLVISHGQGQVHVQIHPVGDDLFVGWQAHLNWAKWSE